MFFRHRFSVLLLLVATLAVPISCYSQATTSATDSQLRWKFKKGQKYRVEMTQLMQQNMMMQNQPMDTENNSNTTMTWTVTDVSEDGMASIEATIDRMTIDMKTPMGEFKIDSNEKNDPPGMAQQIGAAIRPMIGVKMQQKVDARGKVHDVVIPEEALAGLPQGPAAGAVMDKNQMQEMITKFSAEFPVKALEVGDTWEQTSKASSPIGELTASSTYNYEGITTIDNKLLHRIGVSMEMAFPDKPNAMGIVVKVVEQDTKGTMFFDQQEGQLVNSEVEQAMKLSISVATHEMQQDIKTTMKILFTDITGQ